MCLCAYVSVVDSPSSHCLFSCFSSDMEEGGVVPEQFVQSALKSSAWILVWVRPVCVWLWLFVLTEFLSFAQPWELDSSISPENREVIEKMLLEEQYPFTDSKCTAAAFRLLSFMPLFIYLRMCPICFFFKSVLTTSHLALRVIWQLIQLTVQTLNSK